MVDDFGVKYVNKADAHHLIDHLSKEYKCTVDWDGKIFLGIHLDWNYDKRTVDLSMPNYVTKARHIFNHKMPTTPEHSPHPYTAPRYGKHQQMVDNPTIRPLTPANRKIIERFVGLFQYYGRTLDGTMLASISSIATNMTTAQQKDLDFRIKQFLNYAATHPDAKIRFIASEMHLWIHSDASYLTEPKARSRAGGFFYLSKKPNLPIDPSQPAPPDNGPILILCKILDTIMSSAQEAETGAAFVNTRKAIPMRQTLEELGHNQGPTPIQLDKKTTDQWPKERRHAPNGRNGSQRPRSIAAWEECPDCNEAQCDQAASA